MHGRKGHTRRGLQGRRSHKTDQYTGLNQYETSEVYYSGLNQHRNRYKTSGTSTAVVYHTGLNQ